MYEVEVKVRADHDAVEETLRAAGAEPLGAVVQADTYYDAPHREFAATDEALRVRRERRDGEATARLTYKGPLVDERSKSREEVETGVESGDDADAILDALGFAPVETVRKERTSYRLGGCTVTLDDVDGLGEFVEVETTADAVDPAREEVFAVLDRLGLDPDEQVRTSYLELLLG